MTIHRLSPTEQQQHELNGQPIHTNNTNNQLFLDEQLTEPLPELSFVETKDGIFIYISKTLQPFNFQKYERDLEKRIINYIKDNNEQLTTETLRQSGEFPEVHQIIRSEYFYTSGYRHSIVYNVQYYVAGGFEQIMIEESDLL